MKRLLAGVLGLLVTGVLPPPTAAAQAERPFVLVDSTVVKLRLTRTISSADARIDDRIDFEVVEDVKVNDVVVIARGSPAWATVTEAQRKRRMGRGGKLHVTIDKVQLVSGERVALRAVKEREGGGNSGTMTGAMVATSLVFFPAAPLFLFMHGKDTSIPKGTEITAYVHGEATLDPAKFLGPGASHAPVPKPPPAVVTASGVRPLTNQDVFALRAAGLSNDLIVAKIYSTPADYQLGTEDLIALQKAHLSEAIIQAMLDVQAKGRK